MLALGMTVVKMLAGAVARDVLSTGGRRIGQTLLAGILRGMLGLAVAIGMAFLLLYLLGIHIRIGAR